MDKFHPGERVELTRQQKDVLHARKKDYHVDWSKRRGTVVSHSLVTDAVMIKWDGRASVDQWPSRALQKIED